MADIENGFLTSNVVFRKITMTCPGCNRELVGIYKCKISISESIDLGSLPGPVPATIAVDSVEINHDCRQGPVGKANGLTRS